MAETPPISADPNSDEFKEIYSIVTGVLEGFSFSGRYEANQIIEATDQAVTDFEERSEVLKEQVERSGGRKW